MAEIAYEGGPEHGRMFAPSWTPCPGCEFAGDVLDISEETGRASDPLSSEGRVTVAFREEHGEIAQETGRVVIDLGRDSYGSGDDVAAVDAVIGRLYDCAQNNRGPLTGLRVSKEGVGLRGCAAFLRMRGPFIVRQPGIVAVTNPRKPN